jgi:hypothetical protein
LFILVAAAKRPVPGGYLPFLALLSLIVVMDDDDWSRPILTVRVNKEGGPKAAI